MTRTMTGEGARPAEAPAVREKDGATERTATPAPTPFARPGWTRSAAFYRILLFVAFAGAWQLLATVVGGVSIPTFTGTVAAFFELLSEPMAWAALLETNIALLIGYGTSLVLGIPLGLALGRLKKLEGYADIYLSVLLVTPMAALFPLVIIAFGLGLESMILTVTIFAIVVVVVNARSGVRRADPTLIDMARCFGAGESEIWRKILLPAAVPSIMTGVRIGLGRAFTGVIVVELLLIPQGIGGLILDYRGRFEPELLYAAVVVVAIEALLIFSLAQQIERRMSRWRSTLRSENLV